jgi:hypothetical protein
MNTAVKMNSSGERYFIQCKFFLLLICMKLTSVALLRRIRKNPCIEFILVKVTVDLLVKEMSTFNGIRMFVTLITGAGYWVQF